MGEGEDLNPYFLICFPPITTILVVLLHISMLQQLSIFFLFSCQIHSCSSTTIKRIRIKESQNRKIFLMGFSSSTRKRNWDPEKLIDTSRVKQLISGHFLSDIQKHFLLQSTSSGSEFPRYYPLLFPLLFLLPIPLPLSLALRILFKSVLIWLLKFPFAGII